MNTAAPPRERATRPVLITGGGGFIGCNIADALAARGDRVLIFDNLSRRGAEENVRWLKSRHQERVEVAIGDIRDPDTVSTVVSGARAVLHLAAQVAVTTSLENPVDDFEINARGTLNVLEAARLNNPHAPVVFASTNKVYGRLLLDHEISRREGRYVPRDEALARGVNEHTPIDFYSPYGCSKGTAEQYVRDYARVYGLSTVVLRMSCIYGPRQFGNEDQGWVAHFVLQMIRGRPITVYGDGLQVRDILHVSDAAAAWLGALDNIHRLSGRVFNLGGGPENSISLIELLDLIAELRDEPLDIRFSAWRPGDQPWYVSDVGTISQALMWRPRVQIREGLATLEDWLERRFGRRPAAAPRPAIANTAEVQA